MFTIDSGTVDILISEVKVWKSKNWRKTASGYAMDYDSKYNISIDTQGPIPVLIMELKDSPPDWGRGTDLDGWAFNSAGEPQFWIATLLEAVSSGEIPVRDTAQRTCELMVTLHEKCQGDKASYHRLVQEVRFGRYEP